MTFSTIFSCSGNRVILAGLFMMLFCSVGYSQTNAGDTKGLRPAVGLVLSGGGAKGFAYVGLLRVLQETGLQVDYIGGTSIGSIMGGLYALGYHPDTIASMIRSQNWDDLLRDIPVRKFVAYEEKENAENTVVNLPLKDKKIGINSMYRGQEINLLLNYYFSPAYNITDFDKLPTPFLCIGTNLFTGDPVVLKKGYLPMAIRASMSIPGYFTPVDYDGYYLADGGVVNNYPVKEVKDMGASIIIGGDVQSGLHKTKEELSGIPAILDQITSFPRIRANEIGDSLTDLHVRIKLKSGMMDFMQYDSIMAEGERAARHYYPRIKALADSLNAIEYRPLKKYASRPLSSVHVDDVIIRGNKKMPELYFMSIFGAYRNKEINLMSLQDDIRRAYGSGFFESISYSFDNHDGKNNLVIDVSEAGPGEISASVHYDSDYGITFPLAGAFRNVLGHNTKLFADINIAVNPRIRAQYLYGIGGQAAVGAAGEFYTFKVDVYEKDKKTNKLDLTNYKASAYFNYSFKNMINLRAGFDYEYFRFRQEIVIDSSLIPFENFSSYGSLFFSLNADTRDKSVYPTRGIRAGLRAEYVFPLSENWSKELFSNSLILYARFEDNIPLNRRIVLQPGLFAGAMLRSSDAPPLHHWFGFGGMTPENYISTFVPFTGLHFIQDFGSYAWIGRVKAQYNLYKRIYARLHADVGATQLNFESLFESRNILAGYGVTASYNSFIGPLEVSVMGSNINPGLMFFLNLGYWF